MRRSRATVLLVSEAVSSGTGDTTGGVRAVNPLAPGEKNNISLDGKRVGPTSGSIARLRVQKSRSETLAALHSGKLDMPDPGGRESEASGDDEIEEDAGSTPDGSERQDEGGAEGGAEDGAEDGKEREEEEQAPPPRKPGKPADKEEANRQEQLRRKEEQARASIAAERRKLNEERTAWERERADARAADAAERRDVEAFRKAKANAKNDPISLLRALGVTSSEDFDRAGRLLYAASKDPEVASRAVRESEQTSEVATLKQRLEELEGRDRAREEQAAVQAAQGTWLSHTIKAIKTSVEAPVAKALLEKNPAKLRAELWAETERLAEEYGGFDDLDVADVVASFEKRKLAELEELGVDITKFTKAAPSANAGKQNPPASPKPAGKQTSAKTLSPNLATPRVPRPEQSMRERRAETRAMLEREQLE